LILLYSDGQSATHDIFVQSKPEGEKKVKVIFFERIQLKLFKQKTTYCKFMKKQFNKSNDNFRIFRLKNGT
jgi:hypothetical protein